MIDLIQIRVMKDEDLNFVISSWLKSYRYSTDIQRVRDSEYYDTYQTLVKSMIKRSDVYVACLREDEDVLVGYLAIERKDFDIIHYVFVKDLWRKIGVAKYLLRAAEPRSGTKFTHWTSPIESISNKYEHFIFNPFLIYGD